MNVIIGRRFSFDIEYIVKQISDSVNFIDLLSKVNDLQNLVVVYVFSDDLSIFEKYITPNLLKVNNPDKNEIEYIQALEPNKYTIRIPHKLYHATLCNNINSIRKNGLGKDTSKRLWDVEEQKNGGVFLADDEDVAYNFVESADYYNDQDIVVFEINRKDIDLSRIFVDMNLLENLSGEEPIATWYYNGTIPYNKLKVISCESEEIIDDFETE